MRLAHLAERQPRGNAFSFITVSAQDLPIARACRRNSRGHTAWDIRSHARLSLDLFMSLGWKLPSNGQGYLMPELPLHAYSNCMTLYFRLDFNSCPVHNYAPDANERDLSPLTKNG